MESEEIRRLLLSDKIEDIRRALRECNHLSLRLAFKTIKGGSRYYLYQCNDCGQRVGQWVKKASIPPNELNSLVSFDEEVERGPHRRITKLHQARLGQDYETYEEGTV